MQAINVISQLDVLQSILEQCCEQHEQCKGCKHLGSCLRLWDKASEQAYSKSFTDELLKNYVDEFRLIWQERSPDEELFNNN